MEPTIVFNLPEFDTSLYDNRAYTRILFAYCLSKHPGWIKLTMDERQTIVRRIERAVHTKTVLECQQMFIDRLWENPAFTNRYSTEVYRITSNLDKDSSVGSEYLSDKIISGGMDCNDICDNTSDAFAPNVALNDRNQLNVRLNQHVDVKHTTRYKCRKCGACKAITQEVQLRAADELSSLNLKCLECNNTWIVG